MQAEWGRKGATETRYRKRMQLATLYRQSVPAILTCSLWRAELGGRKCFAWTHRLADTTRVWVRLESWQLAARVAMVLAHRYGVDTLAYTGRRHMRGHRGYNCCCVYGLVSGGVLSGTTGAGSLVCKLRGEGKRCNGDALPQAVPKQCNGRAKERSAVRSHTQEELLHYPTL